MKIKVKDIEANPFRDLVRNPVKRDKIESLKSSIADTGFWDNVVVRPAPGVIEHYYAWDSPARNDLWGSWYEGEEPPLLTDEAHIEVEYVDNDDNPGKFQLAYGHHRWVAVDELGIEYVDIPVRDLDDATMLKMMAAENMSEWSASPAVITEAVWAAKQFLDDAFDECETLEELNSQRGGGHVAELLDEHTSIQNYAQIRSEGVGGNILSRFLGKGWGERVRDALPALAEDAARVHADRLRKRQERERLKAEAARQEAERQEQLRQEAEERALKEALEAERLRVEAVERAKVEAARELERKAEEARLAEEKRIADEARKAREAEERKAKEAEEAAIAKAKAEEDAARKAAQEAKAAEDRIKAEERRKELEAQRKVQEEKAAAERAEKERLRLIREKEEALARKEHAAKMEALAEERRKAQAERALADKAARDAEAAKQKAIREEQAAKAARVAAEQEAKKRQEREEQAKRKAKEHEIEMRKLEAEGIDRYAFELFEVRNHANAFYRSILNYKIPRKDHKVIAEAIIRKYGKSLNDKLVTTWIYEYALTHGYIKKPKTKDQFKDVKFDSLCIGVAEKLNAATKEMRRILGEVNKILGYEQAPAIYHLHDYFFSESARNQLKKELDAAAALARIINLEPQKPASKDITPKLAAIGE
jgi:hypothetical protein